jgi:hypothetical protein
MSNANLKRTRGASDDDGTSRTHEKKQKGETKEVSPKTQATAPDVPKPPCRLASTPVWANICSFLNWKEHLGFAEISRLHNLAHRTAQAWNKELWLWPGISVQEASFVLSGLAEKHQHGLRHVPCLDVDGGRTTAPFDYLELNLVSFLLPALRNMRLAGVDFPIAASVWSKFTQLQRLSLQDCQPFDLFGCLCRLPSLKSFTVTACRANLQLPIFSSIPRKHTALESLCLFFMVEPDASKAYRHDTALQAILMRMDSFPNLTKLKFSSYASPYSYISAENWFTENLGAMCHRPGFKKLELLFAASLDNRLLEVKRRSWVRSGRLANDHFLAATEGNKNAKFAYTYKGACDCVLSVCKRGCECDCEFCIGEH